MLAAVDAGTPPAEIVRMLRVSLATIGRDGRLHRAGDSLAGKRPRIGEPQRAALEAQLAAVGTEASLAEHGAGSGNKRTG